MVEPLRVDGGALMQRWPLRAPRQDSDKEERGTVVVVGGAPHTPGAVLLAGIAALRVGAGKLTAITTEVTAPALAVAVPEAGVLGVAATRAGGIKPSEVGEVAEAAAGADCVLIGPGMADPDATADLVSALLERIDRDTVVVLDALATTCGVVQDGLGDGVARTVITPNRAEAERLIDDADGPEGEVVVRLAERYGVTTVFGSHVASAAGDCWLVPKGNAGLGTSGSGDVLAGAVAGIAARTGDPVMAGVWGLFLHGTSGDRLSARIGPVGFLARELLDELPGCLRDVSG